MSQSLRSLARCHEPSRAIASAERTVTTDASAQPIAITAADLATALRPELAKLTGTKVVFVDFDPSFPWREAIDAVDRIRSVATDREHDEIKVALKVRPEAAP